MWSIRSLPLLLSMTNKVFSWVFSCFPSSVFGALRGWGLLVLGDQSVGPSDQCGHTVQGTTRSFLFGVILGCLTYYLDACTGQNRCQ